jgi:hypothetical protein|tara:strand:+ start:397 stop:621 length:225 start_codon:yes stop_codon:yes gene_type:complete
MKKPKITWEEGMTKCLGLYTEALFKGDKEEAIEIGHQMIAIGKTLDSTQKFLEKQNKTYNQFGETVKAITTNLN